MEDIRNTLAEDIEPDAWPLSEEEFEEAYEGYPSWYEVGRLRRQEASLKLDVEA